MNIVVGLFSFSIWFFYLQTGNINFCIDLKRFLLQLKFFCCGFDKLSLELEKLDWPEYFEPNQTRPNLM